MCQPYGTTYISLDTHGGLVYVHTYVESEESQSRDLRSLGSGFRMSALSSSWDRESLASCGARRAAKESCLDVQS